MAYLPDAVVDALRSSVRLGVFFRVGTTPALHAWMGVGECPIGITGIDPAGTEYIGAGRLIGVPELELLINGKGDQLAFGLSGVDIEFVAQLATDAPEVRGASVIVGIAPLDERWQPMTSIIQLWRGTADFWASSGKAGDDPQKSRVHSITLHVGVGDTSRAQFRNQTFTTACQQRRSPGDRFFERVPRYVQQLQISWPRF